MFEIVIFGVFCVISFALGALVANNNKAKTEVFINDLKEQLEKLKEQTKGE